MYDRRAVDEAQAHIRDIDITGELPLAARRQLKESLAALLPGDDRALTFNGVLELTCAQQAWPVWQTAFPTESRPMDLAQAAVSMITEERTSGSPWVSSEFVKVKTYLDDKFLLGPRIFSGDLCGVRCLVCSSPHPFLGSCKSCPRRY